MFSGILAAIQILFHVGRKLLELHNAGVDDEVIDDIHDLAKDFHSAIDEHHTNAGLKNE